MVVVLKNKRQIHKNLSFFIINIFSSYTILGDIFMNISVTELKQHLLDGVIVDIRSIEKYNNHHLPHAIHIPYAKLAVDYKELLDKDKKYYIYCEKGLTSPKICHYLNKRGYQTYNLLGGYEEWIVNES